LYGVSMRAKTRSPEYSGFGQNKHPHQSLSVLQGSEIRSNTGTRQAGPGKDRRLEGMTKHDKACRVKTVSGKQHAQDYFLTPAGPYRVLNSLNSIEISPAAAETDLPNLRPEAKHRAVSIMLTCLFMNYKLPGRVSFR
jgi:hypothetical protein